MRGTTDASAMKTAMSLPILFTLTARKSPFQMKCMKPSNAGARENAADSDILRPAPDEVVKVMQLVWDMFETALDLGDDAARYRLFDTAHALAAVYLPPDWLGSKPIVS